MLNASSYKCSIRMLPLKMLVNRFVLYIGILALRTFKHFWERGNRQIDLKVDKSPRGSRQIAA
jgi:hypothetical protein